MLCGMMGLIMLSKRSEGSWFFQFKYKLTTNYFLCLYIAMYNRMNEQFNDCNIIVIIQCRCFTKSLVVKLLIVDIQRAVVIK